MATYYALVSVDMVNATDAQRRDLYAALVKEGWTKVENLTTTWNGSIVASSELKAHSEARASIERAEKSTSGTVWSAVQVGVSPDVTAH